MRSYTGFYISVVAMALIALISGCDSKQDKLRIAAQKWPGYEFMFMAQREGWLNKAQVEIIETASATDSLSALEKREVDGAALTLDEVLRARSHGIELHVVLVFDESVGADAVYTRKPLKRLDDIKGLRIGVEKSAVGALLLHKLLELAKLKETDVTIVDSAINQHIEDWRAGRLDAVITYEPISTQLTNMNAHRLIDTREMPELIFDVLAIRADAVNKLDSQVKELVKGHFRALQHFQTNPQDAAYRMGGHLGLKGVEVIKVFHGLEVPNPAVNRLYLQKGNEVEQALKQIANVMHKTKMLQKPVVTDDIVTQRYIPQEE